MPARARPADHFFFGAFFSRMSAGASKGTCGGRSSSAGSSWSHSFFDGVGSLVVGSLGASPDSFRASLIEPAIT